MSSDLCVCGLGTMGGNLARNFARNGFKVTLYNRSYQKTQDLIDLHETENFIPAKTAEEAVATLKTPRVVLIMVTAEFVDPVFEQFLGLLKPGDILIDGGNSHWKDTDRRQLRSKPTGIHFIGMGVSGGEEGALNGPSMMFGGEEEAWNVCQRFLVPSSAKSADNSPCVAYVGRGSAGHFVKMVHNAIEYADMQLIAETYDILIHHFKLTPAQCSKVFAGWNKGILRSYLIEITSIVLAKPDEDGQPLVTRILDRAEQKGTGKWAAQDSFDIGSPTPAFAEAVAARVVSSLKEERVISSKALHRKPVETVSGLEITIDDLEKALYAAKIICYAQGFAMIQLASNEFNYGVDVRACARIWRGGCIIRADFLSTIADHYTNETKNLLMIPHFTKEVEERLESWRKVGALTILKGIPTPLFLSTISYYDSYSRENLPANLIQGLRDFFGAHTYERTDKPGKFHTKWE